MAGDKKEPHVPAFISIVAGGVSGVITRCFCQPLDVIKIRFQLQVEPISKQSPLSKYKSMPQAVALIVREEGIQALWKGHVPAQALSLTYGVVQFGIYDMMAQKAKQHSEFANEAGRVDFVCGFIAGCMATILTFPLDVVRTRLVVQGNEKIYPGTFQGLKQILRTEGIRGWFKGLTPTLIQIGPLSGVQFSSYHFYRRLLQNVDWLQEGPEKKLAVTGTMAAGSLAGFTAKVVIYPLDLSRKRLQLQGFQSARKGFGKNFTCSSLMNCFHVTLREEQMLGLYKGFCPSLIKATVVSALIFSIYEKTYNYLCDIYKVSR